MNPIYVVMASLTPKSKLMFIGCYPSQAEAEAVVDDLYEAAYGTRPALKNSAGQYVHRDALPGSTLFAQIIDRNVDLESYKRQLRLVHGR